MQAIARAVMGATEWAVVNPAGLSLLHLLSMAAVKRGPSGGELRFAAGLISNACSPFCFCFETG